MTSERRFKKMKLGKKGASGSIWILLIIAVAVIILAVVFKSSIENILATKLNLPQVQAPAIQTTGPDATTWYGQILIWLGLGSTWALVISSLMVMLILISAFIDIFMSFSLFQNKAVQVLIAVGLGVIAGVSGVLQSI